MLVKGAIDHFHACAHNFAVLFSYVDDFGTTYSSLFYF